MRLDTEAALDLSVRLIISHSLMEINRKEETGLVLQQKLNMAEEERDAGKGCLGKL